jgi:hypothetical protein
VVPVLTGAGTAGAEEVTGLLGAGATETGETPEVTAGAGATEVERAGQSVTVGAQEVMVSTSMLVTVIWATEAPAKRARAAKEKRILMVCWWLV